MGGGGSSGPTLQQQQLETAQALTTANLNLEENAQRKAILNAMSGTRVFRGSALSRAVAGNNDVGPPVGAPSKAQKTASTANPAVSTSLLDNSSLLAKRSGSGATTAGGTGASGAAQETAASYGSSILAQAGGR